MRVTGLIRGGLAGALLLLAACTDLSAVRDFSRLAAGTAEYGGIVQRYAAYDQRMQRYRPGFPTLAERRQQAEGLRALQGAVTEYMTALGALAEDAGVAPASANPLAEAATRAGVLEPSLTPTVSALGGIVLRAATEGWRQRQVSTMIGEANAPLQSVIAALVRFVEATAQEDRDERNAAMTYYGLLERRSPSQPAGVAALKEWRELRLAEIDSRAALRRTYLEAMRKIAAGHQLLYDNRGGLSLAETQRQIRAVNRELQTIGRMLQRLVLS